MRITYAPGATPLDPEEALALIPSSIGTMAELNEFEQENILSAQEWALRKRRPEALSDEFVRGLHKRMFGMVWKWAGKYRLSNKNIGCDWHHVPSEVRKLCGDVAFWIARNTYPWDEIGARFHHRLVSIHPFPNGNGRHARLMTDILLTSHGQDLFSWGANSNLAHSGEARSRYISALREADDRRFESLLTFARS